MWSTVSENVEPGKREAGAVGWVNGDFKTPNGDDKGDGLTGVGTGWVHAVRAANPMPSIIAALKQENTKLT